MSSDVVSPTRWGPEELALPNRRLEEIDQIEWTTPGGGVPGRNCGSWRNFVCQEGGEVLSAPSSCGRRDCPRCGDLWAAETAKRITKRLRIRALRRLRITDSLPRTPGELKARRKSVIAQAKAQGITGGCVFTTRTSAGRISYHIVSSDGPGEPLGEQGLVALLSKAALVRRSSAHAVTWYGSLSYRTGQKLLCPGRADRPPRESNFGLHVTCIRHLCLAFYTSTTRSPAGEVIGADPPPPPPNPGGRS